MSVLAALQSKAQVGNWTTTGAGAVNYHNVLDNAGGQVYAATINKAAGTDVLVRGALEFTFTNNNTVVIPIAVNDGSIDIQLGQNQCYQASGVNALVMIPGMRLLTGYGAGNLTLTMRTKLTIGATIGTVLTPTRNFLSLIECNNGGLNVACTTHIYTSTFTPVNNNETDVLTQTGGVAIAATLNKRSAASKLLIIGMGTGRGNGTSSTVSLGARVNGVTSNLQSGVMANGTPHTALWGEVLLPGIAAGPVTATLRQSNAGGTGVWNHDGNVHAVQIALLEVN